MFFLCLYDGNACLVEGCILLQIFGSVTLFTFWVKGFEK